MTRGGRGFNMILLGMPTNVVLPSCPKCNAVLIKNPREESQLMCPVCGFVPEEELVQKMEAEGNKPELTPKVNPIGSPMLIQGKSRKRRAQRKLCDESGNEINQQDTTIKSRLQG